MRRLAVVRIRGTVDVPYDVEHTLMLMKLVRRFWAVVIDDRPSYAGMLQKVKDWVTWGEIDAETLTELLLRRGRLVGERPLTDEYMRRWGWGSVEEFAYAYVMGEVPRIACRGEKPEVRDGRAMCIPGLKPFFRLHPPRGGLRSIKKHFTVGGDLGYRGPAINDLLLRMV